MLVIPELKIIFIKPRKVAGTSFQEALLTYISGRDQEGDKMSESTQHFTEMKALSDIYSNGNSLDFNKKIAPSHLIAQQLKARLPDKIWNNYLKVSIVRCPYDTMISEYYCVHSSPRSRVGHFNIFTLRDWQCVDNYQMLCVENRSAVDFIIRYENIEEDIQKLERKLGVSEGRILEPFKHTFIHLGRRPPGQDVCKIYSKHPLARAIIDERMNAAMNNELVARYYPIYKERLSKQLPPLGYFPKKIASRIYDFRVKRNGYLRKLYRLRLHLPKRKDRRLV